MFSFNQLFKDRPKGLTLPEYKSLSNHDGDIKILPLYDKYYLSLLQRDGQQAIPTVNIGDKVNAGDCIARPTSHLALHRHAPTSGEVSAIVEIRETHPSGMLVQAIEITSDGLDSPSDDFPPLSEQTDRESLIERIFHAGIAGMGGAGFPTEKKINLSQPVETLIINGAECEPYITCDDLLMRHDAEAILRGALIVARILSAHNLLIGIEDNKPEAIAAMQAVVKQVQTETPCHLALHVLPTQYPMGSRHQIAHYLLGKRPNVSGRSYQSGFVCHNVATVKAVYDAVVLGKPLIERLVTFSGDGVEKAGVYRSKCGTDLADIAPDIGLAEHLDELIVGGTMMGFAVPPDQDKPMVIKRETTSILAFQHRPLHTLQQDTAQENCIRCGKCADVCPMDLLPQQLHFYGQGQDVPKLEQHRLFDCIECGLCNYVCPSNIPLVQLFQHSKGNIIAERKAKAASATAKQRYDTRNARIADEKRAKAQKAEARRAKLKALDAQKTANQQTTPVSLKEANPTASSSDNKHDLIAAAIARTQAKKRMKTDSAAPVATDKKTESETS